MNPRHRFLSLLILCAAAAFAQSDAPLPAPALIAPPNNSTFTNFPRTVRFRWGAVPQAASYAIEIDCMDCCVQGSWCSEAGGNLMLAADLKQPEYKFDFWGNQKGRWRVWAVDAQAQPGFKSAWSGFEFTSSPILAGTKPLVTPPVSSAEPIYNAEPVYSAEPIYNMGKAVTMPRSIYAPNPSYTESARRAKVSGDVLLQIVVGSDGRVKEAKVLRSLEPSLDASALEAVRTWKFEPAVKDGHPVALRIQVSTSFRSL